VIVHLVLFRPKPGLDATARRELASAFGRAIAAIGSVRRARLGRRRTFGRPYELLMREDYTHAAMLEFDDIAGLRAYLEHPEHDALGAQFYACFESALMYDYEVTDGQQALSGLLADQIA
jgi:hypothetical protein